MSFDKDTVKLEILEYKEKGKPVGFIKEVVRDKHDLSMKEMNDLYNEVAKENGWPMASSSGADLEVLVRTLRENKDKKDLSRTDLVKMMADKSGYTENTANHMLSQLRFAEEYAKQEAIAKGFIEG